jgi:ABC-2 type transport system ATP-binding protein
VTVNVRDLVRRFGDVGAVDGVSFDVKTGELFGLVGPDGAGKTTLLRMLAGELVPTSGDASVMGTSVTADPEQVKNHIAYMSQQFGLYADLTVHENLEFYANLYRVPAAERQTRRERLYRFSNLEAFKDRPAGKLSGGMKQKLGLSCALIHEPRLQLLDEPTFGVDPVSRRDLWIIIHEMVARGVTAVVSTAYLDEAERFDRLALLHRGHVLALDGPKELQQTLAGRLLAVRIESPSEAIAVAETLPAVQRANVFGEWLHMTVSDARAMGKEIEAQLRAKGIAASGWRVIEPSLEDVFMARVQEAEGAILAPPA